MYNERTLIQKVNLFLKGLAMGGANKVPGVSGGMVAFVMGFYEELIFTFQRINAKAFKLLLNGRLKSFAQYTNLQFLALVMLGSMFSYFSVSLILDYFLKHYELYVWAWFFGMIIGSIFYISKDFNDWRLKNVISLILGASIGIAISFMTPAKENDNLWFVFVCGIIGVSGMTLPGLSGSFILILLGNYVLLLVDSVNALGSVITSLLSGDFEVLEDEVKIRYLKVISVFTAGSAFGLVSISHVLGYVLKRWHQIVTAVIIGFITGSLGIVWPWKKTIYKVDDDGSFLLDRNSNKIIENYERFLPDFTTQETWISIAYIVFGIALILIIEFYGRKRK
ncbi:MULTISPECIES: DUF368 domain-containing protein [unclassified Tenacibaculum]|uniref:DUF368 domain-containing protein n=1 Tax=unclassified Tenacibaculum TaxID=2635139 RepID=UPI001F36011D|nr:MULTISPECIES: DUF368 domain-containing protein [unclassified Tenacibaculum]MCF2876273.1 DUF368 domain-containing protein [Tenacibaculum sp. Cn5-1]MCF2936348.1 DUF368 domain-containing protein [Tenacibaculum sp. Cn5-34]MCG7511691.1 DUF368 domain-containing protein [Tenacibaculum sp. Cn5-46]